MFRHTHSDAFGRFLASASPIPIPRPRTDRADYFRVEPPTRLFHCFTGTMGELRRSGRSTPTLRPGISTGNGDGAGTRDHRPAHPARTLPPTGGATAEAG
ncbi:hypothetical protein GCM10007079_07560 [Nocardiopsis terrae]|nr:hypothetical protein GCM10007079_07560 [Nocardiopsis terrae]